MNRNEIIIFETEDHQIKLEVNVESETVWLSANQMALLFERDEKTIRKHINNVFSESEVDKINNTQKKRVEGVKQLVPFYTLDVIISVGYRVKSKRGVEFRRWANSVLKQYILKGYAVNDNRIRQLGEVIRIMKRTENELDSKQVLSVIEKYSNALDLLDSYDHQNMTRPKGNETTYVLQYEECMEVIQSMRFGDESDLFGKEKDDSFKGSIGNIYQSCGGVDIYESLEEKAANLLYFVTKNHSFFDGNKRIAATMFLYFLDRNSALFVDGKKKIEDSTLVALTIMIAESRPEEKEMSGSPIIQDGKLVGRLLMCWSMTRHGDMGYLSKICWMQRGKCDAGGGASGIFTAYLFEAAPYSRSMASMETTHCLPNLQTSIPLTSFP